MEEDDLLPYAHTLSNLLLGPILDNKSIFM